MLKDRENVAQKQKISKLFTPRLYMSFGKTERRIDKARSLNSEIKRLETTSVSYSGGYNPNQKRIDADQNEISQLLLDIQADAQFQAKYVGTVGYSA